MELFIIIQELFKSLQEESAEQNFCHKAFNIDGLSRLLFRDNYDEK